jgi:hypothetical protein
MMARTLSRVAWLTSAWLTGAPVLAATASAFACTFFSSTFSTTPQLPSSAETSSPFAAIGQLARFHEAPLAAFTMSEGWSSRALKKACHSSPTEAGSASYLA